MRQILLDDDLQDRFIEAGFVQVPTLSAEEIAFIRSELATLRPDDNFAPTGRNGFKYSYHCSFLDTSIPYKRAAFDLITSVFAPHIKHYLNDYDVVTCSFYLKPPGTGAFQIHQNWPMISNLNETTVTLWTPLGDVTALNGALHFVKGSHKILPHIESPTSPAYFNNFRKELIQRHLTPLDMKAGESVIFDDSLIHWSPNNNSDTARIAIQIALAPIDAHKVFFFFDRQHPERFELVEADHEFYLASDVVDLTRRQPNWKHVGFVENQNRLIDEEEFVKLLKQGPERRKEVYASTDSTPKRIAADTAESQRIPGTVNAEAGQLCEESSNLSGELLSTQSKPSLFSRLMGRS